MSAIDIISCVGKNPGITLAELIVKTGLPEDEIFPVLAQAIKRGELLGAGNGKSAIYSKNPAYLGWQAPAKSEKIDWLAPLPPEPATSIPAVKPEVSAKKPTKEALAIAHLKQHGDSTTAELAAVLGLTRTSSPSQFLGLALKKGTIVRAGRLWKLGGSVQAECIPPAQKGKLEADHKRAQPAPEKVLQQVQTACAAAIAPALPAATAEQFLYRAAAIMAQRGQQYDQAGGERSMAPTVQVFNIITRRTGDRALTESEGWLLQQILKDVRQWSTPEYHADSAEDGVSYSALKAEALAAEAESAA